jgi:CheY-like chemotaxis protein/HPt (histidine-containing phosphotransfer) domain-containing protein
LADDAEINRAVGKGLLESLGYEVDTVWSGADAVDAMRAGAYTAVLMDCLMPVMDGYEATAKIRELEGAGRRTPVIALTAAAMSGDRERCLAAGMDDYVSKPFALGMVVAALARCRATQVDNGLDSSAPEPDSGEGQVERALVERLEGIGMIVPPETFNDICTIFLSVTPELITELGTAVRAHDRDTTIALAHKLKGSMATVGALRLSGLAQRVEKGDPPGGDNPDDVLDEMEKEFSRARAVVVSVMSAHAG